jgi:hypothetical protein
LVVHRGREITWAKKEQIGAELANSREFTCKKTTKKGININRRFLIAALWWFGMRSAAQLRRST